MEQKRMTKEDIINSAEVGALVAFRDETGKMISAKISEKGDDVYTLETKNGSVYYAKKEQIEWVREPGKGWPNGIYNAFMRSKKKAEAALQAQPEEPTDN